MNNNPIKLFSSLTETAIAILKKAVKEGIVLAKEDVVKKRVYICYDCPHFVKDSTRCELCGCYMLTKIRFDASKCPKEMW